MENKQLSGCLRNVLESPLFARAQRQSRLLRHIVEHSAGNRPEQLKEFSIAIAVFDRDESYDPQIDSTVRVEVSKLRTRLAQYYAQQGSSDPIRIVIPKGGYTAEFHPLAPPPPEPLPQPARTTRRWFWITGGTAAATTAAAGFAFLRSRPGQASIGASIRAAEPADRGGLSPAVLDAVQRLSTELTASGVPIAPAPEQPARFQARIRTGRCWEDSSKVRVVAEIRDNDRAAAVWSRHWTTGNDAARDIASALHQFRRVPEESESRKQALRLYDQALHAIGEEKSFVLQNTSEKRRKASLTVLLQAAALLEEAHREDPTLSDATAKLAWVYHLAAEYDDSMQGKVKELAARALASGPSAHAHFVLGYQSLFADWNPPEAQRQFAASLDHEIFHKDGVRLHTDVACMCGWSDRAAARLLPVLSVEPRSPILRSAAFVLAHHRNDAPEMERLARETITWDGGSALTHWQLGQSFRAQGKHAQAEEQFRLGLQRDPGSKKLAFALARLNAAQGRIHQARQIAASAGITQSNPSLMALLEVEQGDTRKAAQWIERAISQREIALCYLALEPRIHQLRADAGFAPLFARLHLPSS